MNRARGRERLYQGWSTLADKVIDKAEISRFVHGYYKSSLSEEEYGMEYLRDFFRNHPEHKGDVKDLLMLPGIGAYVTHWFLEKSGAICR